MSENVPLTRRPDPVDYEDVSALSNEACYCRYDMELMDLMQELPCQPCAARQALNELTAVADEVRDNKGD